MFKQITIYLLASLATVTIQVHAAVYTFNIDNPSSLDYGTVGEITNFNTSYNDANQQLSFSSTITQATAANIDFRGDTNDPAVLEPTQYEGNLPDNFWLVLSDGPDPKTDFAEYTILYGDAVSGDLAAYVYDSSTFHNGAESWTIDTGFIQSFGDAVTRDVSISGQVTFDFTIDSSFINAWTPTLATGVTDDWNGVAFAEQIGIWYHPVMYQGDGAVYNSDGSIFSLDVLDGTWYDTAYEPTTVVPVPAAAWLFGSGLLGLVAVARRKNV